MLPRGPIHCHTPTSVLWDIRVRVISLCSPPLCAPLTFHMCAGAWRCARAKGPSRSVHISYSDPRAQVRLPRRRAVCSPPPCARVCSCANHSPSRYWSPPFPYLRETSLKVCSSLATRACSRVSTSRRSKSRFRAAATSKPLGPFSASSTCAARTDERRERNDTGQKEDRIWCGG